MANAEKSEIIWDVISSFLFLLSISAGAHAQTLIDSIIAVVNTDAITRSELENEFRIAALMQGRPDATPTTAERRAVLDTIITRKFVLQEAERRGIVVTQRDTRVAEKIAEIRAGYTLLKGIFRAFYSSTS